MNLSDHPLVSIICLTYNHEGFVVEALRGIFSQTYPNLDIVITDDGSSDSTAEMIRRELAGHTHRNDVRLVCHERNLGEEGRLNFLRALELARGDFVVMSCGDDVMLPTMVERMAEVWLREDVSLVTTNAVYIDEHSNELSRYYRNPSQPYDESFDTLARDGANVVCFGAAMGFERTLYYDFGWPPIYLNSCDIILPFYAYLAKGARFIPEPLLRYRVHAKNASLSLQMESNLGVEKILVEEQTWYSHLAHAFYMEAELGRLQEADPPRFSEIARAILPLLQIQEVEMARKLVKARIALQGLGVKRLTAP